MSEPSTIQWRYDAADSWLLRVLAHGFVAGLGGTVLLAAVGVVLALPALVGSLGVGPLALVVLLALIGGPASLLYLWPMIRDPDQRPGMGEAVGDGAHPWSPASTAVAGGLFLGTGVLAALAASEAFVGLYVGVVLGLLGILFVVAGWRGV